MADSAGPAAPAPSAPPWTPEGTDLARSFVQERTGVAGEVPLRSRRRSRPLDPQEQVWSGAGEDPRDPARAGAVLAAVLEERGWQAPVAVHSVSARWAQIVGRDVAAHSQVASFDDGLLVVRCDSTAWASQLRHLVPDLLRRMAEEVGPGVVGKVVVQGPTAPSWVRGPRRVKGRGPRDTYG